MFGFHSSVRKEKHIVVCGGGSMIGLHNWERQIPLNKVSSI